MQRCYYGKKIFSTRKIQFDMSKSTSETESLKCIHLTQLSDLSVLCNYVIREKRKITTLICNLCYPYLVHAMHRIWLLPFTLPRATLLAQWGISNFILVFFPIYYKNKLVHHEWQRNQRISKAVFALLFHGLNNAI